MLKNRFLFAIAGIAILAFLAGCSLLGTDDALVIGGGYINGYVAADMCDRGEWAFQGGNPCPLGEPQLVHYEDLYIRPEPHYPDSR